MPSDREPPVPPAVADRWDDLIEDAEATAAEYREAGWEPLLVHPGDVTPLSTDDRFGLDVLVPGDEYEAVTTLAEDATFDESHVYRTEDGGVRFLVVVVEATETRDVVVIPAYLPLDEAPALERRATEAGEMYTDVRPLTNDEHVRFSHDDPDLFF